MEIYVEKIIKYFVLRSKFDAHLRSCFQEQQVDLALFSASVKRGKKACKMEKHAGRRAFLRTIEHPRI